VTLKFLPWDGELDAFDELQEAWVQVVGIPPKMCAWSVFAQVASVFGLLVDVDWAGLFKSFYAKVRLQIAYGKLLRDDVEAMIRRVLA
jgi:hypothetical protein